LLFLEVACTACRDIAGLVQTTVDIHVLEVACAIDASTAEPFLQGIV